MVGPPGIEAHLAHMNEAGAVASVTEMGRANLDLRFVEVDGSWQQAGPLRFRAVEVVHVPYLRCFGYLFDRGGRTSVGYSGDTTPCDGLTELARESEVLVVECNGRHTPPGVQVAHGRGVGPCPPGRPSRPHLVLTHLGEQVDTASGDGHDHPGRLRAAGDLTV